METHLQLETIMILNIFKLEKSITKLLKRELSYYNLSAQHGRCLLYISNHPNITLSILSKNLSIDTSQIHKIIEALLEQGLIVKNKTKYQKYNGQLKCTNKGLRIANKLRKSFNYFYKDILKDYSNNDIDTFISIFSTLTHNIFQESLSSEKFKTQIQPLSSNDFLLMAMVQNCWNKYGYISCQECTHQDQCDIFS